MLLYFGMANIQLNFNSANLHQKFLSAAPDQESDSSGTPEHTL